MDDWRINSFIVNYMEYITEFVWLEQEILVQQNCTTIDFLDSEINTQCFHWYNEVCLSWSTFIIDQGTPHVIETGGVPEMFHDMWLIYVHVKSDDTYNFLAHDACSVKSSDT